MEGPLFDYLPREAILAAYERAAGSFLAGSDLTGPDSSAALVANTFGLFLIGPERLPPIPGTEACGWPAERVGLEECARFPWWPAGDQSWLDVLMETETHVVGIESTRYEPFREKPLSTFPNLFWRDEWGKGMKPFESMRDRLVEEAVSFERLDAAQLVKHAFALRTEGERWEKAAVLVYLYAEPVAWPDGTPIAAADRDAHASEAQRFAREVEGAEVEFRACTYAALLDGLAASGEDELRAHAERVRATFHP
ncbi:MAG TPA: hypothetical protein VGC25_10450 [Alphaproteobacteria bacterium]|jgi:hypothetical protein